MTTKEFLIEGMSCKHCIMAVEKELSQLQIQFYEVKIGSAKITYDENKIKPEEIIKSIEKAGYKAREN
ncbi:MAG: heavy-metal-associated domain-containing protein [Melioribacter sp.]|nr:heavy-metal-associated domain-containing protein [Melioribacter sp.]